MVGCVLISFGENGNVAEFAKTIVNRLSRNSNRIGNLLLRMTCILTAGNFLMVLPAQLLYPATTFKRLTNPDRLNRPVDGTIQFLYSNTGFRERLRNPDRPSACFFVVRKPRFRDEKEIQKTPKNRGTLRSSLSRNRSRAVLPAKNVALQCVNSRNNSTAVQPLKSVRRTVPAARPASGVVRSTQFRSRHECQATLLTVCV